MGSEAWSRRGEWPLCGGGRRVTALCSLVHQRTNLISLITPTWPPLNAHANELPWRHSRTCDIDTQSEIYTHHLQTKYIQEKTLYLYLLDIKLNWGTDIYTITVTTTTDYIYFFARAAEASSLHSAHIDLQHLNNWSSTKLNLHHHSHVCT